MWTGSLYVTQSHDSSYHANEKTRIMPEPRQMTIVNQFWEIKLKICYNIDFNIIDFVLITKIL